MLRGLLQFCSFVEPQTLLIRTVSARRKDLTRLCQVRHCLYECVPLLSIWLWLWLWLIFMLTFVALGQVAAMPLLRHVTHTPHWSALAEMIAHEARGAAAAHSLSWS